MSNKHNFSILADEDIVSLAHNGDNAAYDFMIEKYRGLAKTVARKYYIAGGDNEDLVQEGMIGIFKAVRDFEDSREASFRTFAEMCINRQIQTAITGANRQKHKLLNESISLNAKTDEEDETNLTEIIPADSGSFDPEEIMIIRDNFERLKMDSDTLFSPSEKIIWEELLKGKNYREIAFDLRKSTKTVDNAIQRIKKKTRSFLQK